MSSSATWYKCTHAQYHRPRTGTSVPTLSTTDRVLVQVCPRSVPQTAYWYKYTHAQYHRPRTGTSIPTLSSTDRSSSAGPYCSAGCARRQVGACGMAVWDAGSRV
eukprot:591352-Rhodomonas_salina.1